jgi:hypothetical protein
MLLPGPQSPHYDDDGLFGPHKTAKGTLQFNPEFDFMHIRDTRPPFLLLAQFLHDFRAHDPRHLGILNVAWDPNSLHGLSGVARESASELSPQGADPLRTDDVHFRAEC